MIQWKPRQTKFDYTLINGAAQLLYLGQADTWIDDADPRWTIKKFTWETASDATTQLAFVETLGEVAWFQRATLPWT